MGWATRMQSDRIISLQFNSMVREGREGRLVTLVTRKRIYLEVKDQLPHPVYEAMDGGFRPQPIRAGAEGASSLIAAGSFRALVHKTHPHQLAAISMVRSTALAE